MFCPHCNTTIDEKDFRQARPFKPQCPKCHKSLILHEDDTPHPYRGVNSNPSWLKIEEMKGSLSQAHWGEKEWMYNFTLVKGTSEIRVRISGQIPKQAVDRAYEEYQTLRQNGWSVKD